MRNGVGVDARGKTSLSAVHWRISYFWVRWTLCYPVFLASSQRNEHLFRAISLCSKGFGLWYRPICQTALQTSYGLCLRLYNRVYLLWILDISFPFSSISRTDWEDRDRFFVLHQSAFLTPLVVSTLLRFGFRLFEKRKRGHSAGWERSYSLPFHRISNLFKTLGSSSMTGPGSADFYSRTKPSWLFIFLQVMTCGCQCGSSFSAGPGPPMMNGIFKVCHGTEPPFLRILPA